jgi:hypothetical protein
MNYRRLLTTMIMASLLFLGLLTRFVGVAEAAGASEEATNRLHALRESATPERRSQTGLEREPALSLPPAIPPPRPLLNGTSILTITTTADPTSVDEPGGVISYTVSVTNITDTIDITITALTDNSGDLNGKGDCSTSSLVLNPSQNYTCSYTATVSGNGGQSITNTITATAQYSGTTQAQASDDATVTINDITPSITVQLDNDASGDDIFTDNEEGTPNTSVTFQLVITNNTNEDVTIDTISDDHSSPMTSSKSPSCASISTNLAANSSVTCYYDGIIPNDDNLNEVYTVTVDVLDDETNPGSDDDTSTVLPPTNFPILT